MPRASTEIIGYPEFIASLSAAEKMLTDQNMLRRCLAAGARPVRDEARAHAPRRHGYLARGVQVQTNRKGASRHQVFVYVNIRKAQFVPPSKSGKKRAVRYKGPLRGRGRGHYINPRNYAHLTEFGSGPRFRRKSGGYSGRMPARPWLWPAWERRRAEAYRIARDQLRIEVSKVVHRVRRRAAPVRRAA